MNAILSSTLPHRQQQLYDALVGQGDVEIRRLCSALEGPDLEDQRTMQQWLGPYILRLNKRLTKRGLKVVTGKLKGTYALVVVK